MIAIALSLKLGDGCAADSRVAVAHIAEHCSVLSFVGLSPSYDNLPNVSSCSSPPLTLDCMLNKAYG